MKSLNQILSWVLNIVSLFFLVFMHSCYKAGSTKYTNWTASSEFGTYCLCEQPRFRRACASAQSHQNLCCSLIQAVSQEEPLDRKPDPWPLWMAGHAQLKFAMTECSKTQIHLTGPNYSFLYINETQALLQYNKINVLANLYFIS